MEAWTDLAMVAHELGGALTPTRNSLQLLQGRNDLDVEQERLLLIAGRGLDRAERVLQNLSSLAHLEHTTADAADTELQPLLQRVVDEHQLDAGAAAVALRLDMESDAKSAAVEPFALEQVLANLLSNAIKFTGPEGRISVVASKARGHSSG